MHTLVTKLAASYAAKRLRRAEQLQTQFELSRRSKSRPAPHYFRLA
jgi:hypothetical protein